jgi:hypothetical protein
MTGTKIYPHKYFYFSFVIIFEFVENELPENSRVAFMSNVMSQPNEMVHDIYLNLDQDGLTSKEKADVIRSVNRKLFN